MSEHSASVSPTFSDYIVFVDESGDHDLASIRSEFPVFVLAFCVFAKEDYVAHASPALQRMKFRYFGHDTVVFHEREIRKAEQDFKLLYDRGVRSRFMSDLSALIDDAPFTIIAVAIHKQRHVERYAKPDNPYHLALEFGLERVGRFLVEQGQSRRSTHIVFERRGKREDDELELEFRRIVGTAHSRSDASLTPFEIQFADKKCNSCGLQLADLVARPIGLRVLRPDQENRAWTILERKIRRSPTGRMDGWGLKVFP